MGRMDKQGTRIKETNNRCHPLIHHIQPNKSQPRPRSSLCSSHPQKTLHQLGVMVPNMTSSTIAPPSPTNGTLTVLYLTSKTASIASKTQEYANDGNFPIGTNEIINAMYNMMFNKGVYCDDYSDLNDKHQADKTTPTFKSHFTQAQCCACRHQKVIYKLEGFNCANVVVRGCLDSMKGDLTNMVTAAADYCATMKVKSQMISQMKLIVDLRPVLALKTDFFFILHIRA